MAPLIELLDVSRHYASGDAVVRALDKTSLTIHQGEFVAIMGQSGSGKSTLMNILGCLDRPTSGTYRVNGRNVATLDSDALAALRREKFRFYFQRYNLLANATASENVEIPAVYAGTPSPLNAGSAHRNCWNVWALAPDVGTSQRNFQAASNSVLPSPAPS